MERKLLWKKAVVEQVRLKFNMKLEKKKIPLKMSKI